MTKTLKILDFISANPDNWQELLKEPPYWINIKTDGRLVILSYNQFESDFNNEIVRECRGLILRAGAEPTAIVPVCVPFFKFGNYGEGYCPEIDWNSARVQTKVDGSIMKCFYDGQWRVATNNTINAKDASVFGRENLTYDDLFQQAWAKTGVKFESLDTDCTYMFELVSPENQVVIPYPELKIYHIGTRNNRTLEELDVDIGIEKPKEYKFDSMEACVEAAKKLPYNEEGYVVVDRYWNRVKIKSPAYVSAHLMKNNGIITVERFIDLLRSGELDEFLTYFPEFKEQCEKVNDAVTMLNEKLSGRIAEFGKMDFPTQKDFALAVKDDRFAAFFFEWKKNGTSPLEWMNKMSSWKLSQYLDVQLS